MAQHVKVSLIDDITGGDADETVTFGLDGHNYEIDLATEGKTGAEALRKALEPYVAVAQRISGKVVRKTPSAPSRHLAAVPSGARSSNADSSVIRAWALSDAGTAVIQSAGLALPRDKGRLSSGIVDLYEKRGAASAPVATPKDVAKAVTPAPARKAASAAPVASESTSSEGGPSSLAEAAQEMIKAKKATARKRPTVLSGTAPARKRAASKAASPAAAKA